MPDDSPLGPALEASENLSLGIKDGIVEDGDLKTTAEGVLEGRPDAAIDG